MPIEIKLPQWGMNMNDGTVIKWLKTVGDKITKDEPLVEIESTKVSSAVEALEDGILGRIDVEEGVLVPVGAVLGLILLEGEKIEIYFKDTGSPALIKDPGDFDSIFVVMPMKG